MKDKIYDILVQMYFDGCFNENDPTDVGEIDPLADFYTLEVYEDSCMRAIILKRIIITLYGQQAFNQIYTS